MTGSRLRFVQSQTGQTAHLGPVRLMIIGTVDTIVFEMGYNSMQHDASVVELSG